MKRIGSPGSLSGSAFVTICPIAAEELSPRATNLAALSRDSHYTPMLDDLEEAGHVSEKKRRLSVDQVKALEKNFEVENKLEPERKVKLAQELGLQPRQVAVWFQNRRARWKTKQLERDYEVLKSSYDQLRLDYEGLRGDNEELLKEIRELKSKLKGEENSACEEEEEGGGRTHVTDTDLKNLDHDQFLPSPAPPGLDYDTFNGVIDLFPHADSFRDSDSDSSAVLNDDLRRSPDAAPAIGSFQFVKMEQHDDLFAGKLFSDETWYCADQWG